MSLNPVHRHCGPWNTMDALPPNDPVDRACWFHDKAYAEMGVTAYTTWNDADEKFINDLESIGGGSLYQFTFRIKYMLYEMGYIKEYQPYGPFLREDARSAWQKYKRHIYEHNVKKYIDLDAASEAKQPYVKMPYRRRTKRSFKRRGKRRPRRRPLRS